jgi:decaprenylphospho-beta-D-erythro-pentofuranosid-2-ulose 2-reductase
VNQIRSCFKQLQEQFSIGFAIIASAHLPQENQHDDFDSILETFSVNSTGTALAISSLASQMKDSGGTIIYLSSVACIRPRTKNFSYAASKRGIDFFTLGLAAYSLNTSLNVRVIRPGFVYSKLSKGFQSAPFAISPFQVAKDVTRGLKTSKTVIYSPRVLKLVMAILRVLPEKIFRKL